MERNSVYSALPGSTEEAWLVFSGAPTDSASNFVQAVQRKVFLQDRVNDDQWPAEYASTCFVDGALLWYLDLDEKTRMSWSKLRGALLSRYSGPIIEPEASEAASPPEEPSFIPQPPAVGPAPPAVKSASVATQVREGRIEVFIEEYAKTLGYLAYDANSATFSIVENSAAAHVFSFTKPRKNKAFHLRMEGPSVDARYPYVGLAVSNSSKLAPHVIPSPLRSKLFGSVEYFNASDLCVPKSGWPPKEWKGDQCIATWVFRACTESSEVQRQRRSAKTSNSQERASSALWKYDERSNKLSIFWMMDNDKEGELHVIVPNSLQAGLHVHRAQDWKGARSHLEESEARLYFIPEESG